MTDQKQIDMPSSSGISSLRENLSVWFSKNKRDYPWRSTTDPFRVLIAEMMLRRTRADQVKGVYVEFFSRFPDPASVSVANDSELEKILYPLGLRWRNPAFKLVARSITGKYGGKVPETRGELARLPGVGEYVAGAVLSVGYGKTEWIVDSNVVRVFRRYFGIRTSREGRRDKHVIDISKTYVQGFNPGGANLALIDFAALVCRPNRPSCERCPLTANCCYYTERIQHHSLMKHAADCIQTYTGA